MSRDVSIVELSSDSDSDNERDSKNLIELNAKIESIDVDDDDDDNSVEDDDDDVQIVSIKLPEVPSPAAAPQPTTDVVVLDDDEEYFAPKNDLLLSWKKCRIVSEHTNTGTYKVRFSCDNDVRTFPRYQIALDQKPSKQLLRGTRVIAALESRDNVKYFYAGVIGETIALSNAFHYLIFFDNGHVNYVPPKRVREMMENDRWLHVHENARIFMNYYFGFLTNDTAKNRAGCPRVEETLDARFQVERDGKWKYGKIVETQYGSLIKIEYEGTKRTEWFYRGSPRLGPIWRKYVKVPEVNPEISLIEAYSSPDEDYDDDSDDTENNMPSTSSSAGSSRALSGKKLSGKRITRLVPETESAYQAPREYTTHECSSRCSAFNSKGVNLKKYGPLALPMIMGWTRMVTKRIVSYTAPCGKIRRNIESIRKYLQDTKCKLLDVDNFSYEHDVDCLRVFESNGRLLDRDLSRGTEARPIRVINVYGQEKPEKFTYVTKMFMNRNVPNYEEHVDSMSCCNCIDDCYDRSECPCWTLTYNGLHFADTPYDKFGYDNFKRLNSLIPTGIFECNENCKCSKKCSNRVAQQPIAHNLELYKTRSCGWGVQCRNDLPKGAFICCYVGDLMTEEHCEQLFKKYGDTYLAQLNFIEIAEEFKEGYEAHAPTLSNSLSGSDSDRTFERPPAKKARTSFVNESTSESSRSATSSSSTSDSIVSVVDEPNMPVISYFPRMEPTNEVHPTRQLFGRKEAVYIIDGKRCGNIGRFFNHSCEPNMFLQNVFFDTHDLRFPRLALFTTEAVRAGTQLTWDYNYAVGSVPNRCIKCECGARHCRGRLL